MPFCWKYASARLHQMQLGMHDEAVSLWGEVLKHQKGNQSILDRYSSSLFKAGRYKEALAIIDEALALSPTVPTTLIGRRVDVLLHLERPGGSQDMACANASFDRCFFSFYCFLAFHI